MYTTQKQIRAAFWAQCASVPGVSRRKITDYSGSGRMYNTDTRCAFVDFVDALQKNGEISPELSERVTL